MLSEAGPLVDSHPESDVPKSIVGNNFIVVASEDVQPVLGVFKAITGGVAAHPAVVAFHALIARGRASWTFSGDGSSGCEDENHKNHKGVFQHVMFFNYKPVTIGSYLYDK